jgi:rhamnosyltransferase
MAADPGANHIECEQPTPTRETAVAIVVTHRPDPGIADRVARIREQFAQVIVVDNHSDDERLAALREFAAAHENVLLVQNAENIGVAAALNQGCRLAAERGAAWVVTFDQDSLPAADLLGCLAAEWERHPERARLGLVGVNFRSASGRPLLCEGTGLADARTVITSGSLLSLAAWWQAGPFREDFFIDEVDHEYALRLRRHGWLVKVTRRVLMEHDLGTPQRRHAWQPRVSHHSALRRYYMVRNRLLLAREHLGVDPRFVFGQLARSLRESATILLFEPEKKAKVRAMSRGLLDGLRGRAGRASWHSA